MRLNNPEPISNSETDYRDAYMHETYDDFEDCFGAYEEFERLNKSNNKIHSNSHKDIIREMTDEFFD